MSDEDSSQELSASDAAFLLIRDHAARLRAEIGGEAVDGLFLQAPWESMEHGLGERDVERRVKIANLMRLLIAIEPLSADFVWPYIRELQALLAGDSPALFAQLKEGKHGRSTHRFKVAELQLTAIKWRNVLRASGMRTEDAQSFVSDAYCKSWETIKQWPRAARAEFGHEFVNNALFASEMLPNLYPDFDLDDWRSATLDDGLRYREAMASGESFHEV